MLECNRFIKKKMSMLHRILALVLVVACAVVLLAQTAAAKNTYLINDGERVLIHTTYATDPAEILNEAGLELGEDDTYITQNGQEYPEITVQRRQIITVVHGKKTIEVSSYGETVKSLLQRLDLILTKEDVVSVPMDTVTYDGMTVSIYRAVEQEETYTKPIPHETVYCYDATLPEGEEKVLTVGVDGQVMCTASVYYVDGKEISRTVKSEVVVRQPVSKVIAIGTYTEHPDPIPMPTEPAPTQPAPTQPAPTQPAPTQPRPTQPAPTQPAPTQPAPTQPAPTVPEQESNGMPVISDGVITTPDGEVLHYSGEMQAVATAYNNTDPGCTIYTAIGTLCRVGAIAVDPTVIPYGTRMYIVSNDGVYIYGVAVAEDCGGSIKGNRIDLYFDTTDECWEFGIRDCTVYFLD